MQQAASPSRSNTEEFPMMRKKNLPTALLASLLVASSAIARAEPGGVLSSREMQFKLAGAAMAFLALLAGVWLISVGFSRLRGRMSRWEGTVFRPLRFHSHEIMSARGVLFLALMTARGLRILFSLGAVLLFLSYVTSLFPLNRYRDGYAAAKGVFLAAVFTVLLLLFLKALNVVFSQMRVTFNSWRGSLIRSVQVKSVEILSEDRILGMLLLTISLARLACVAAAVYLYAILTLGLFEATRGWSGTLVAYLLKPIKSVLLSITGFLPNLFYIAVIILFAYYLIRLFRFFFSEVEKGALTLPGFYPEWAMPTFKLVRFLVFFFALIVVFPYIPGSDSPGFKGLSVFLGLLLSLGSSTAIANIIAGVAITYMRPFKIGDRVNINGTVGDVIEKTLLVTRIRTIKNVDITVPNSMVLNNQIINYSSSAAERGLILNTTVTIGYDAPWRKVHELLCLAARSTPNILETPAPFILQTALNDFYVSYELNAYTDRPDIMAATYSLLHQNIQDRFNEGGVEIMSPHYAAYRNGNEPAVPEEYRSGKPALPIMDIFPPSPPAGGMERRPPEM